MEMPGSAPKDDNDTAVPNRSEKSLEALLGHLRHAQNDPPVCGMERRQTGTKPPTGEGIKAAKQRRDSSLRTSRHGRDWWTEEMLEKADQVIWVTAVAE